MCPRSLAAASGRSGGYSARASYGEASGVGAAFGPASDLLTKLSRYETTLERTLYRALHELQRLQAARAGQAVPPPVALDADVTVAHLDSDEDA
jgi:hypothetical protein